MSDIDLFSSDDLSPTFDGTNWVFRLSVQRSGSAFSPDGVFCIVYGG